MKKQKVLIIGGGLAGLSAGIHALLNGFDAEIFEQHTLPGGVCTAWKREGYLIDGCIHWLMGARPGSLLHRIYGETGALDEITPEIVTNFGRYRWEETGQSFDLTSDLAQIERDWIALSPEDKPLIRKLTRGIQAFQSFEMTEETIAPPSGFLGQLRFFWRIRRQLASFARYRMPVRDFASRLKSPFLRWQIENTFVPEMPTYFLMMILGALTSGQLFAPKEGSLAFASGMAEKFKKLGGTLHLGTEVAEIVENDGCATGLRLRDGTIHSGDYVISAADLHFTLETLLGGRHNDPVLTDCFEKWPLFDPILIVGLGIRRKITNSPSSQIIELKEGIRAGKNITKSLFLRWFNHHPGFAPVGCTAGQVMLQTDFETWEKLSHDPKAYETEKTKVREEVLKALERFYRGIRGDLAVTDVATPMTFVRYTRNYRGAWEGWLMTPEAFGRTLPKTLPGITNFFLCGQWVEPGGGVPTVLLSGRAVIQKLTETVGRIR